MPATKRTSVICGTAATALLLTGCATTYNPPATGPTTYGDEEVRKYLAEHVKAYTEASRAVGDGQDLSAAGTILAALVGTTALALGAGPTVGILSGSAGAGLNAANGYARPRDRLILLAQAVEASRCIEDNFNAQVSRTGQVLPLRKTATQLTSATKQEEFISTNVHFARQSTQHGRIAVDAARAISSSLMVKWHNLSVVPDYAATLKAIQDAQRAAAASPPPPGSNPALTAIIEATNNYEAEIAACKAKFPA